MPQNNQAANQYLSHAKHAIQDELWQIFIQLVLQIQAVTMKRFLIVV